MKRWPTLHHFVAGIYFTLQPGPLMELIVGTKARVREWANRHLRKGNNWNCAQYAGDDNEWVLGYWDSRNHSHRPFLIDKISGFYPFTSILETGCNCGPNLYLAARKFPGIDMTGIDINPMAIEKGREFFATEGISNVKLSVAKADELGQFQDNSFDVVFTDAVLIYIGKDKIHGVIKEMVRIARKGLVLVEKHSFEPGNKDRHGLGIRHFGTWQRDYTALLKQFVPETRIHTTKITEDMCVDPGWQEAGAIIEVGLESVTHPQQPPRL